MKRRLTGRPIPGFRSAAGEAIQRYRHVLSQRNSRALLIAALFSVIGDWLNFVALMALAYDYGDGAIGVGGMLALRLVPGLVFQGFAGAIVDRVRTKRLLILTQLTMAVLAWSFILLNAVESIWLLYVLVVLLEIANTVARPAFMVELIGTVAPDNRGAVNGLFGMTLTIAQFVGSLIGALVLGVIGVTPLFIINGLTFAAIAFAVSRLNLASRAKQPVGVSTVASQSHPQGPADESVATTLVQSDQPNEPTSPSLSAAGGFAGYAQLLVRPDVFVFSVLTVTISLLIQGAASLFEVRARALDQGEGGGGAFFAAVAVGFLLGGAIAGAGRYRSKSTLYLIAIAESVGTVGLIAFGYADSLVIAFIALVITGISAELSEIPAFTFFQNRLPTDVYGRFFSLYLMATALGGLAGALIGPLLERYISEGQTMVVLSIPGMLMAATLVVVARFGEPDEPAVVASVARERMIAAD
ncbi:MAG: MFS transporter [Thermomicrobiales bacterium]